MTNAWDDMKKAKEDQYFEKQNVEAIHRLKEGHEELPAPRTSKPMTEVKLSIGRMYRDEINQGIYLERKMLLDPNIDPTTLGKEVLALITPR